jgi:hypothetical protein
VKQPILDLVILRFVDAASNEFKAPSVSAVADPSSSVEEDSCWSVGNISSGNAGVIVILVGFGCLQCQVGSHRQDVA